MDLGRTKYLIAMAMLVATYVVLRFWGLTESCLWFDEIFGVHAAGHGWDTILSFLALDLIHPPLFYVLLKLWVAVGGEALQWLRLFPVVFSVLSLIPFIALCRELKVDRPATLLALLLLTVNGALIKYSQEVRMYSMLICLSLVSIWLFARYFNRGKSLTLLVLVNILLVYTHYFGWFVVSAEVLTIVIFQRIKWRAALTMFAIVFAAFLPWVIAVWNAARSGSEVGQNIGWMQRPGLVAILQFKLALIEPFYQAMSSVDAASIYLVSVPMVLVFSVVIVLFVVGWRSLESGPKASVLLLFILAALPVIGALAASWVLPYSVWGTRHLIVVFGPVAILLAVMVTNLAIRPIKIAVVAGFLLLTAGAFILHARRDQPQFIWCAWEQLSDDLVQAESGEPRPEHVYVFEDLIAYHFWSELRGQPNYRVSVVKGVEGITEDTAYFLPRGFSDVATVGVEEINEPRIWIAFREPLNKGKGVDTGPSNSAALRALQQVGYEVESIKTKDLGGQTAYLVEMVRRPDYAPEKHESSVQ